MRYSIFLWAAVLVLGACSSRTVGGVPVPGGPNGDVVVVGDDDRDRNDRDRNDRDRNDRDRDGRVFGRAAQVPPGHYPPPGECRIWYPSRPPGHQPPPGRCGSLIGRVPFGAFLLYNEKAWDTEYDWRREEARRPGSVPDVVLRIMNSLVRE